MPVPAEPHPDVGTGYSPQLIKDLGPWWVAEFTTATALRSPRGQVSYYAPNRRSGAESRTAAWLQHSDHDDRYWTSRRPVIAEKRMLCSRGIPEMFRRLLP